MLLLIRPPGTENEGTLVGWLHLNMFQAWALSGRFHLPTACQYAHGYVTHRYLAHVNSHHKRRKRALWVWRHQHRDILKQCREFSMPGPFQSESTRCGRQIHFTNASLAMVSSSGRLASYNSKVSSILWALTRRRHQRPVFVTWWRHENWFFSFDECHRLRRRGRKGETRSNMNEISDKRWRSKAQGTRTPAVRGASGDRRTGSKQNKRSFAESLRSISHSNGTYESVKLCK